MKSKKIAVSKRRLIINSLIIYGFTDYVSKALGNDKQSTIDQVNNWAEQFYLTLSEAEKQKFLNENYPPDELV